MLATFMAEDGVQLRGARVLELGSGTGMLAMACAVRGAKVRRASTCMRSVSVHVRNAWALSCKDDVGTHVYWNARCARTRSLCGHGGVTTRVAAQVVATDAPWVMELLRFNAQLPDNADAYAASGGLLTVSELIWGVDGDETCDALLLAHGSMDVVVACECVYAMEEGSLGDIYGHSFQVSVALHGVCDGLSRPLPGAQSRAI